MKFTLRACALAVAFCALPITVGCGDGSGGAVPVSDQSEIDKYVEENPSPVVADESSIDGS